MLRVLFTLSLCFLSVACSSRTDPIVQVEDLPQNYDPTTQLSMLEQNLNQARSKSVNDLAPTNFEHAVKAYESAKKLQANRGSLERIAGEIEASKSSLKKAEFYSSIARKNVPDLIETRERLLVERGDQLSSFDKYASQFNDIMKLIEEEKLEKARKRSVELQNRMDELITEAIKTQALGSSEKALASISEEAKAFVPETTKKTENLIKSTADFIEKNRDNDAAIVRKSQDVSQQVERLIALVGEAKRVQDLSLEDKVLRTEKLIKMTSGVSNSQYPLDLPMETRARVLGEKATALREQLGYVEADLRAAYSELGAKSKNLQDLRSKAAQEEKRLAEINKENQKIARIREVLGAKNAQVYQKGDQILVHLIGLEFAQGSYEIPSSRYELLGDVGRILETNFSDSKVTIEGHTDSSGSKNLNQKLARRRAMAVRDFIAANQEDMKENLMVAQANYQAPIATNKTKEGRQQNRRVDLIIGMQE